MEGVLELLKTRLGNERYLWFWVWAMSLSLPFLLGFATVWGLMLWDFPRWEYGRIPADTYGWTTEERLEMATTTLEFLRMYDTPENSAYILEEMRQPGTNLPVYNPQEIQHMVDVKRLTNTILYVAWFLFIVWFVGSVEISLAQATRPYLGLALWRGGLATVVLLLGIALFIFVGWSLFFLWFHQLFFEEGTWQFYYTDSLIRLFPERFWFDVGVILSLGTLVEGLIAAGVGYWLKKSG